MNLFSINYIHFGSPSSDWYAAPQRGHQAPPHPASSPRHPSDYFPSDNTPYPQSLRHKSFLASPTLLFQSSVSLNVLVQHPGSCHLPAWLSRRLQPPLQLRRERHLC
ncbi:hypothetical protein K439DRAFT_1519751, partial [Ramaria rubella]